MINLLRQSRVFEIRLFRYDPCLSGLRNSEENDSSLSENDHDVVNFLPGKFRRREPRRRTFVKNKTGKRSNFKSQTRQKINDDVSNAKHSREHHKETGNHQKTFIGDVSARGRRRQSELYTHNTPSSNQDTLSSGLEPRDTRPCKRPWIPEEAHRSLIYNSALYGSMVRASKDIPIRDDLGTRLVYEHLNSLAGMAGKVQNVILHNKQVFERRILHQDQRLTLKAYRVWETYVLQRQSKKHRLKNAKDRLNTYRLRRILAAWMVRVCHRDQIECKMMKVFCCLVLCLQ